MQDTTHFLTDQEHENLIALVNDRLPGWNFGSIGTDYFPLVDCYFEDTEGRAERFWVKVERDGSVRYVISSIL